MKALWLLLVVISLVVLQGCAMTVAYKPEYLRSDRPSYGQPLEGKVLVYMEPVDRDYVFKGGPNSFVGAVTSVTLPLGMIAQQIGKQVFGGLFFSGADVGNVLPDANADYRAIVRIRVNDFSYGYSLPMGFSSNMPPIIDFRLDIALIDRHGVQFWQNEYTASEFERAVRCKSTQPQECVNMLAHLALQEFMRQAARQIYSDHLSNRQLLERVE